MSRSFVLHHLDRLPRGPQLGKNIVVVLLLLLLLMTTTRASSLLTCSRVSPVQIRRGMAAAAEVEVSEGSKRKEEKSEAKREESRTERGKSLSPLTPPTPLSRSRQANTTKKTPHLPVSALLLVKIPFARRLQQLQSASSEAELSETLSRKHCSSRERKKNKEGKKKQAWRRGFLNWSLSRSNSPSIPATLPLYAHSTSADS